MTQLLERIDAQLRVEQDEFVVAELLAKKAGYLGRVGRSDEAKEIIQFVRQTFNDGRSGRVTCFLQLAEGILLYHAFQNQAALDKFSRAILLAQALRQADLVGICAAWKGFIDFDQSRFESMKRSLLSIQDLGLDGDHAVQSRLSVTLMTGAIMLGEREVANSWFHAGRAHAVAEGDLACIDALLFNRAVFGLARQRVAWCIGQVDKSWASAVRAELESARNLQNLVGITTMRDHIDLCVARLDLIEGRYREALASFSKLQSLDRFAGKNINAAALAIDLIFVRHQIDPIPDLAAQLKSVNPDELQSLDPDERLVAFTIIGRLADSGSLHLDQVPSASNVELALAEYTEYERELRSAMTPWLQATT